MPNSCLSQASCCAGGGVVARGMESAERDDTVGVFRSEPGDFAVARHHVVVERAIRADECSADIAFIQRAEQIVCRERLGFTHRMADEATAIKED